MSQVEEVRYDVPVCSHGVVCKLDHRVRCMPTMYDLHGLGHVVDLRLVNTYLGSIDDGRMI